MRRSTVTEPSLSVSVPWLNISGTYQVPLSWVSCFLLLCWMGLCWVMLCWKSRRGGRGGIFNKRHSKSCLGRIFNLQLASFVYNKPSTKILQKMRMRELSLRKMRMENLRVRKKILGGMEMRKVRMRQELMRKTKWESENETQRKRERERVIRMRMMMRIKR